MANRVLRAAGKSRVGADPDLFDAAADLLAALHAREAPREDVAAAVRGLTDFGSDWNTDPEEGSFSAVSTPIFASKYSFCSIFEFVEIYKTIWLNFQKFSNLKIS